MSMPFTNPRSWKRSFHLVCCALALAVLSEARAAKIAFIQDDLGRETVRFIDILKAQGHDVTIVAATPAANVLTGQGYASQGYDLVIIDEVVGSGNVGSKMRNSPVPVINWEGYLYSGDRSALNADSGLTGDNYPTADDAAAANGGAGADFGQTLNTTAISIIDPDHPLAAGLPSGSVNVFDPSHPSPNPDEGPGVISFAGARTLVSGVTPVAAVPGFANGYAVFGVDAGVANADGTTTAARWVHLPWNNSAPDNRTMIEPSFFLFEAAVAWALEMAEPTKIYDLQPAAGGFLGTDTEVSFSVDKVTASGSAVLESGIGLAFNGVDVTDQCVITDAGSQWDVVYGQNLEANRILSIVASATAEDGGYSARMTQIDTFNLGDALIVEAENFNFTDPFPGGTPGQFFDSVVLCHEFGGGVEGCYFDRVGTQGIDENEINMVYSIAGVPSDVEVYRFADGLDFTREELTDTYFTDDPLVREPYASSDVEDYHVSSIVAGEWLNYTRTMPAGNYYVYARVSSPNPVTIQMDHVDDATVENQTLTKAGRFAHEGTGGGWELVPLTDDSGQTPLVVSFDGSPSSFRMTSMSDGYSVNFYMFAATEDSVVVPPTVTILAPESESEVATGTAISIEAEASAEGTVTKVEFYAGTSEPLTLLGEDNVAPHTFEFTPSELGLHTIRVVATDDTGLAGGSSVTVNVIDPSISVVSTADGNGADAQLNEQSNNGSTSGGSGDFNTRTSSNGDRNEIVALRFDLSGFTLADLRDVSLNIINFRDNSARQVALYGVAHGTAGATGSYTTEDWDEAGLAAFGDMPGLLETDGDFLTQSLNTDALTALGQITFANQTKGSVETFSDSAITDFVQNYAGQSVTFILAAAPGYTSTGQARFASKEATELDGGTPIGEAGDFAPYLRFRVAVAGAPTIAILAPEDGVEIEQGDTINISAEATAGAGVAKVEFFAGLEEPLTLLGEDATEPYSMAFTAGALGTYTIRVVLTDNDGATVEDSVTVTVVDPGLTVVSTAVGAGADAQLSEHTNSATTSGSSGDLNTRTSGGGDRNEVVALRFDLSGFTRSELEDVTLNIINFRNNSAREVALYGVAQGTAGDTGLYTTEDWDESALGVFGDMPGLLMTDGDFLTQSLNMVALTPLGQITFSSQTKGTVETFGDSALTDFIQSSSGDLVTFILAAAPDYTSSGQGRFASKEAGALDGGSPSGIAGDFAPFLSFRAGAAEPPSVVIDVPAGGSVVDAGADVTVTATPTASADIARVQFFAGMSEPLQLIGEVTAAPYSAVFTPNAEGTYTVRVVVTDSNGLTGSDSIEISATSGSSGQSVSTAFGNGADAQLTEQSNNASTSASSGDLNTRTSGGGDRNEIVAIRFDLSGYILAELQNVTLNIINFRDNSAREVALYGVAHGTAGGTGAFTTETWDENTLSVFGDMPGLLETDGDFLTQSLNMDALTALGEITFSNQTKGTVETFDDPAIAEFVQSYQGSSITFILAAAPEYSSSGQARFASKEATALDGDTPSGAAGDFAPYLTFDIGAAPAFAVTSFTVSEGQLTLNWSGGAGPYTVQKKSSLSDAEWTDVATGVTETSATVAIAGDAGFFRVVGQ